MRTPSLFLVTVGQSLHSTASRLGQLCMGQQSISRLCGQWQNLSPLVLYLACGQACSGTMLSSCWDSIAVDLAAPTLLMSFELSQNLEAKALGYRQEGCDHSTR